MQNILLNTFPVWTTAQAQKTSNRGISASNQQLLGIQKLRELILELAVRGKLVPQDPNDEPASELLKKIEAEKKKLIKEGMIKKQQSYPDISIDDEPYDIPMEWKWLRLGTICTKITDGSHNPPRDEGDGIPMLSSQNVNFGTIDFGNPSRFVSLEDFEKENERTKIMPNDVLLTIVASLGRSAVVPIDAPQFVLQRSVAVLSSPVDSKFLALQIVSPTCLNYYDTYGKGTAQKGIYLGKLSLMEIAVPPLAEQHRIVAKVDELMALCDELEKEQTNSNTAHETLVEVLLSTLTCAKNSDDFREAWQRVAGCFDTLFTTEHSIDKLKQTILQLAVMGKLVPQDPNDEPASKLLKKIAKEKARLVKEGRIKKQAALPEITEEEKPFDLPNGWEWVRLNNAIDVRDGTHDTPKEAFGESTYPLVTSKNFENGNINFEEAKRISEEDHLEISKRSLVEKEDILFSMIGGNLGNQVMVNDDRPFSIKNVALFKYYDKELTSPYFIKKILEHLASNLQNKASGGAQPFVALNFLRNIIIALPPFAEQNRIVSKVDELFALCDKLKEGIREAQTIQNNLAEEIVKRVVR